MNKYSRHSHASKTLSKSVFVFLLPALELIYSTIFLALSRSARSEESLCPCGLFCCGFFLFALIGIVRCESEVMFSHLNLTLHSNEDVLNRHERRRTLIHGVQSVQ